MIKPSFWESETYLQEADYLIIGSGIVGLSTAIQLKESHPSSRVVILERGSMPSGASTRNAGFACFGSLSELIADLKEESEDAVLAVVQKRWSGLKRLRERVGDEVLEYKEWGGYELFEAKDAQLYETCKEQLEYFNEKLAAITGRQETYRIADDKLNTFQFQGVRQLIWNSAEGQIHTGKMMVALETQARALGVVLVNGVEVTSYEAGSSCVYVYGKGGFEIKAAKVALCSNGFARELLPELKVRPARNQVLITKPILGLPFKGTFHYNEGYVYFRNVGNRVLLGGYRDMAAEEETTAKFGLTEKIQTALKDFLETVILPGRVIEIEQWWSGIMGIGVSKDPIVKALGPRVYAGVRLGGMGVAIGSLVGEELAALMLGS